MTRSTQRRVGAAALASAVLLLVGCSAPSPTTSEESPRPAAKATSDPGTRSPTPSLLSTMPSEVPFDFDASVFPDSWVLQWVDQFANAPQFTPVPLETPSEGTRVYRDELTQCEILLMEGQYYGPLGSSADDRAVSDAQLSAYTGVGEDVIGEFAADHTIPQPDENGSIAARLIVGAPPDGSSSFATARVVESRGQEAYAFVGCPGEEASALYEGLISSGVLALTIAPPPS